MERNVRALCLIISVRINLTLTRNIKSRTFNEMHGQALNHFFKSAFVQTSRSLTRYIDPTTMIFLKVFLSKRSSILVKLTHLMRTRVREKTRLNMYEMFPVLI